jgi:hypothetical protein
MKRGLSLLVLVLLLIPVIAIAQANQTQAPNITGAGQKVSSTLQEEVNIPENLQVIARIFFGIEQDRPVSWQEFAILFASFMIFFFIFKDVMDLIPFFETKARAIAGAFIVVSLVGLSGGLMLLTSFLMDLGALFGFLTGYSLLTLFFALILLLIIMFLSMTILRVIKRKISLEIAEAEGEEEGTMKRSLKILKQIWGLKT